MLTAHTTHRTTGASGSQGLRRRQPLNARTMLEADHDKVKEMFKDFEKQTS